MKIKKKGLSRMDVKKFSKARINKDKAYDGKFFVDNLGISPVKVAKFHKAMFAKRLLVQSDLKITDIAYASGFGSIRQFNQVMKEVHGNTPSERT